MKTTKPIATISFNSEQFLIDRLEELRTKSRCITFWAFIRHKGEDDEGGKKDHIHLFVEPSKLVQTDNLCSVLIELDLKEPNKPLRSLPFRSSKFSDWYFYALHDEQYLATKGLEKKYHYKHQDIKTSDPDNLNYLVRTIDMSSFAPVERLRQDIARGFDWVKIVTMGRIPIQQMNQWHQVYEMLVAEERKNKKNKRAE